MYAHLFMAAQEVKLARFELIINIVKEAPPEIWNLAVEGKCLADVEESLLGQMNSMRRGDNWGVARVIGFSDLVKSSVTSQGDEFWLYVQREHDKSVTHPSAKTKRLDNATRRFIFIESRVIE